MDDDTLTPLEPSALSTIRRILVATLMFGTAGMDAELLLIGHVEGQVQLLPVCVLTLTCLAVIWLAIAPSRAAVRSVQALMLLSAVSGVAGVLLHYQGNTAFELEMYPDLGGLELVQKTLTGATPVLAPGSMTLLGLVGLAAVLHHPLTRKTEPVQSAKEIS